jgi:hypothetical protein
MMYATGRQVRGEKGEFLGWADFGTVETAVIPRQIPGKIRFISSGEHPLGRPEFEEIEIQSRSFRLDGVTRVVWVATPENREIIESLPCFQPVTERRPTIYLLRDLS